MAFYCVVWSVDLPRRVSQATVRRIGNLRSSSTVAAGQGRRWFGRRRLCILVAVLLRRCRRGKGLTSSPLASVFFLRDVRRQNGIRRMSDVVVVLSMTIVSLTIEGSRLALVGRHKEWTWDETTRGERLLLKRTRDGGGQARRPGRILNGTSVGHRMSLCFFSPLA